MTAKTESTPRSSSSKTEGWRERLSALRNIPKLFKLGWETNAAYSIAIIALRLLRSLLPIAALWIGKLIIDTLVIMIKGEKDYRQLLNLVIIELVIVSAGDILSRLSGLIESLFVDMFQVHISIRLMEHAATLDLNHFEDPSFYDKLARARDQTDNRPEILERSLLIIQDVITIFSLGSVLFTYGPWLLLLIVVAVLPAFVGETYFATHEYSLTKQYTTWRRELHYLCFIGTSYGTAKEAQLLRFSSWLISRFRKLAQQFYNEKKGLLMRKTLVLSGLSIIGILGYYVAYAIILVRTLEGIITLGTLTFLAGSVLRARDSLQRQLTVGSSIYSQALFLNDLFGFFNMTPSITSKSRAPAVPKEINEGLVLKNLSFRYPGSDTWAVRNLNLTIRPGERVALVGENGAGKTTISKLLARLYDPTEGCILLDGKDIREYDLQSFRRAVGVIFQDYVRYDLRFDENIGIGKIEDVSSYLDALDTMERVNGKSSRYDVSRDLAAPPPVPSSIISAAERSLASTLLPGFSNGYRQMLGLRFDKGVELSGGEWQKIAIARAYMRDAHLLILDEPTSSLDPRAEYEVFARFSDLVGRQMAIIISHRFSTVRMADRIIVLKNGSIIEEGTHEDLSSSNGLYAELFTLQAEGYR